MGFLRDAANNPNKPYGYLTSLLMKKGAKAQPTLTTQSPSTPAPSLVNSTPQMMG